MSRRLCRPGARPAWLGPATPPASCPGGVGSDDAAPATRGRQAACLSGRVWSQPVFLAQVHQGQGHEIEQGHGRDEAGCRLQRHLFGPQARFRGLVKVLHQPAAGILPGAVQGPGEVRDRLVAEQEPFQTGGRVGPRFFPDPHHAAIARAGPGVMGPRWVGPAPARRSGQPAFWPARPPGPGPEQPVPRSPGPACGTVAGTRKCRPHRGRPRPPQRVPAGGWPPPVGSAPTGPTRRAGPGGGGSRRGGMLFLLRARADARETTGRTGPAAAGRAVGWSGPGSVAGQAVAISECNSTP